MKVLVIVPAYNEEESIEAVIKQLEKHGDLYDYVIVNDGSADKTSALCHARGYNIIDLPVNLGLAGAFKTGMKYAYYHDYDAAIQIDADGQHRPEFIPVLAKAIEEGTDIAIGSRFADQPKPVTARMIGSRLLQSAIRLTTGANIQDPTSGMRMYGRRMIKEFAVNINFGPEPDTVAYLLRQGASVKEVQVTMDERTAGESYLNVTRSITYMLRMMISILVIQNFRNRNTRG